jgi:hypothetical protein
LFRANEGWPATVALAAASLPVCALTFGTWAWQYRQPDDWVREFQQMNAAGYGFLIGASDEYYMARIYPSAPLRTQWIDLMRRRGDLMFSTPIAGWIGKNAETVIPKLSEASCKLEDPAVTELPASPGIARFTGQLLSPGLDSARAFDLVIAGQTGKITGAGRTIPAATWNHQPIRFLAYYQRPDSTKPIPAVYILLAGARPCS